MLDMKSMRDQAIQSKERGGLQASDEFCMLSTPTQQGLHRTDCNLHAKASARIGGRIVDVCKNLRAWEEGANDYSATLWK